MYPHEFNKLTKKFNVVSGHNLCHPETCTCWEYRIFKATRKGEDGVCVLNTDSQSEVDEFLQENDVDYKK